MVLDSVEETAAVETAPDRQNPEFNTPYFHEPTTPSTDDELEAESGGEERGTEEEKGQGTTGGEGSEDPGRG
eukprot:7994862-Alexandrium_andersonii.AAC.1